MTISAFAPGKLILMGEHAVVYGHPAVAMAVNRGTKVTLSPCSGPTVLEESTVRDPRLMQAVHSVLPEQGISVHIESDLPIGRGMGSSAALAVALARAAMQWHKVPVTDEGINDRAFAIERIFHGTPSGVDHTVSMRGGVVQYRKGADGPTFVDIEMPELPIVVIDSGASGNILLRNNTANTLSINGFNNSDCNLPNTGPNNLIFSSFLCITSVAVICGPCCIIS